MMFFIRGNIISVVIFQPSVLDDSFDLIPVMESIMLCEYTNINV